MISSSSTPFPRTLAVTVAVTVAIGVAVTGALSGCSNPEVTVGATGAAFTSRKGLDYSFARPSPSALHSEGYTFAVRYLSYDNSGTHGKILFAGEANALIGAGLDVVSNWEYAADDALNGYNAGVNDAKVADAQAAAAGAPATRPIYFSVDFDATPGDQTAINAYFDGVASVIGHGRTGAYGGYYVIKRLFDAGKIAFGWQTYAWSGGQWDARAQLRQTQNGITAGGDGSCCDLDETAADDFGQWGHAPPWAASYVSQSWPLATTALTIVTGQTVAADIELKNSGSHAWDTNTKLGTTQPRDRASVFADGSWPAPNRAAHVNGTIAPGGTFKFSFNFHAPSQPGTYHEFFDLVAEGQAWFSDPGQGGPPDNQIEAFIEVVAPAYSASSWRSRSRRRRRMRRSCSGSASRSTAGSISRTWARSRGRRARPSWRRRRATRRRRWPRPTGSRRRACRRWRRTWRPARSGVFR